MVRQLQTTQRHEREWRCRWKMREKNVRESKRLNAILGRTAGVARVPNYYGIQIIIGITVGSASATADPYV